MCLLNDATVEFEMVELLPYSLPTVCLRRFRTNATGSSSDDLSSTCDRDIADEYKYFSRIMKRFIDENAKIFMILN